MEKESDLADTLVQRQRRDAVVLRILVFLDVGLIIVGFFMGVTAASEEVVEVPPPQIGLVCLLGVLLIVNLASSYGLFRLRSWAAWLYTVTYFAMTLLGFAFFDAYQKTSLLDHLFEWLASGIPFAVMAMAHFSCAIPEKDKVIV